MKKVVTFGEILLRFTPVEYRRFVQSDIYHAMYGGSEANVAISLANYGLDSAYVTKLPNHEIGQAAINSLRQFGVDTENIVRGGDRVGVYFCENGIGVRPDYVIYDRKYSSISMAMPQDFDWESILNGADLFHFTGITAAVINPMILKQALSVCKAKNITVSVDYNYRSKLRNRNDMAKIMREMVPYCDIFIGGEDDAKDLLGAEIHKTGDMFEQLKIRYGFRYLAVSHRESVSAKCNLYSAKLYANDGIFYSEPYNLEILDRIGGGDAFDAGLLFAVLNEYDSQDIINFATAAGAFKSTVLGDCNMASVGEVKNLIRERNSTIQR